MVLEGAYKTNGRDDPNEAVVVTKIAPNQYRVENPRQWDGVGIFDGENYRGIFRYKDTMAFEPFRGLWGVHEALLRSDGSFAVHGRFMSGDCSEFDAVWVPERR